MSDVADRVKKIVVEQLKTHPLSMTWVQTASTLSSW